MIKKSSPGPSGNNAFRIYPGLPYISGRSVRDPLDSDFSHSADDFNLHFFVECCHFGLSNRGQRTERPSHHLHLPALSYMKDELVDDFLDQFSRVKNDEV